MMGGGRVLWDIYQVSSVESRAPVPQALPRGRKGGPAWLLELKLLSFPAAGWEPSTRARTEGPLCCPSPHTGSQALFSFHPLLLGFNGQKLCPPAPLW